MPKVSVIVPVYNAQATLERCIKAILNQIYVDFELILVDDGSTDESAVICDKYNAEDARVKVFHKNNGGVSSARNLGLEVAVGDYITFADADDYPYSDWIEAFCETMGETDICAGGKVSYFNGSTGVNKLSSNINSIHQFIIELWRAQSHGYVFLKMFKRSIIEEYRIRFDESFRFREDDIFVAQYIEHIESFSILPECRYIYFLPDGINKYNQRIGECSIKLYSIYEKIFNGQFPEEFVKYNLDTIHCELVYLLKNDLKPPVPLLHLYIKFIEGGGPEYRTLRKRITFFMFKNSRLLRPLSSLYVKMLNK